MPEALSPLRYLKQELQFTSKDWLTLTDSDRNDLRKWAREEMEVLNLPIATQKKN